MGTIRTFYVHDAKLGEGVLATLEGATLVEYDDTVGPVDVPSDAIWPLEGGKVEAWIMRKLDEAHEPTGHGKHAARHDAGTCRGWRCTVQRLRAHYPSAMTAEAQYVQGVA